MVVSPKVRLFIHPCEAAHALNAFKTTSVTRWEVNTFPPTTAALEDGLRIENDGIFIIIGERNPFKKILK